MHSLYIESVNSLVARNSLLKSQKEFLISQDGIRFSSYLIYLALYKLLQDRHMIDLQYNAVFDALSLLFYEFRTKRIDISFNLFDELGTAICATIFHDIISSFPDFHINSAICILVESQIRYLLIGFDSPNVSSYHERVCSLLPELARRFVAQKLLFTSIKQQSRMQTPTEQMLSFSIERTMGLKSVNRKKHTIPDKLSPLLERAFQLKHVEIHDARHMQYTATSPRLNPITGLRLGITHERIKKKTEAHENEKKACRRALCINESKCDESVRLQEMERQELAASLSGNSTAYKAVVANK